MLGACAFFLAVGAVCAALLASGSVSQALAFQSVRMKRRAWNEAGGMAALSVALCAWAIHLAAMA